MSTFKMALRSINYSLWPFHRKSAPGGRTLGCQFASCRPSQPGFLGSMLFITGDHRATGLWKWCLPRCPGVVDGPTRRWVWDAGRGCTRQPPSSAAPSTGNSTWIQSRKAHKVWALRSLGHLGRSRAVVHCQRISGPCQLQPLPGLAASGLLF